MSHDSGQREPLPAVSVTSRALKLVGLFWFRPGGALEAFDAARDGGMEIVTERITDPADTASVMYSTGTLYSEASW